MNLIKTLAPNSIICLMAPTASGKTSLAFKLYETGRFELISVDSALIYQAMNIGTAKPTTSELQKYPHYLVDIIKPNEYYSVINFINDVDGLIKRIHQQGKIPLLVGGTMMYYMALFNGISNVPATTNIVREQITSKHKLYGNQWLYGYLHQHDPITQQRLMINDTQRLMRAVEVHWQTNQPLSYWQNLPKIALSHNPNQIWYGFGVMPDREWLHKQIAQRLDAMWQAGFVQEMIDLIDNFNLQINMPSMRCVGYRQVLQYLQTTNQVSIDATGCLGVNHKKIRNFTCQDTKNKALYATRQLAKRQYTWLRQLSLLSIPTQAKTTITLFNNIKEVEKYLL